MSVDRALSLRSVGDLRAAINAAQQALVQQPDDPLAIQLTGILYCEDGALLRGVALLRSSLNVISTDGLAWLNLARAHERLLQPIDARRAVARAVVLAPSDTDSWRGYTRLILDSADPVDGRRYLGRLVRLASDNADTALGAADASVKWGDLITATRMIFRALALEPNAPESWSRLTSAHQHTGFHSAAIISIHRSIQLQPTSESYRFALVTLCLRNAFGLDALDALNELICIAPSFAEAWVSKGVTCKNFSNAGHSISYLYRALTIRRSYVVAEVRLTRILLEMGRRDEALLIAENSTSTTPMSDDAWAARGLVLRVLERAAEAGLCFARCCALNPGRAEYWVSCGVVAQTLGSLYEALSHHQRALLLDPYFKEGLVNMAYALKELGLYHNAMNSYAISIVMSPDFFDNYMNSAICNLLLGRFKKGWAEYEFRWRSEAAVLTKRGSPRLKSDRDDYSGGRRSEGCRVLVWGEQGVGDEVMFGGLVGEFRGLCGEMLLQVDGRLRGMFERALPGVRVFSRGERVPEELYDEQIPMGSLGKWLRPTRESFEGKGVGYLRAREGLGRRLREELGVGLGERLIGLSWRSEAPTNGAQRSVTLKELACALGGAGGVRLLNLQYGAVGEEIEQLRRESGLEVLSHPEIDNREDLEGLAGLIEGCDLVVSVGNATAHLSGALGQRTWVLLPYVAGWRWLHEGSSCPWYPSVRLYRQSERGQWGAVLEALGKDALHQS